MPAGRLELLLSVVSPRIGLRRRFVHAPELYAGSPLNRLIAQPDVPRCTGSSRTPVTLLRRLLVLGCAPLRWQLRTLVPGPPSRSAPGARGADAG